MLCLVTVFSGRLQVLQEPWGTLLERLSSGTNCPSQRFQEVKNSWDAQVAQLS